MQCKIIAVILAITMILSLGLGCCVEKKEIPESMPPIQKSIPVVDLHCDSMLEIVDKGRNLSIRSDRGHLDVPRMQEGEVKVQCFAAWISPIYYPDRPFGRAKKITDAFERLGELPLPKS
jgi:hypothetical protein